MRLSGNALAIPSIGSYSASVEGKFSGDRYEGRGKFLARDCNLTFSRR